MAKRKKIDPERSEAKGQEILGATLWSLSQEGQTVKQIADRYGMSRSDVRLAIKKAKAAAADSFSTTVVTTDSEVEYTDAE
jgi:DNA-binding transcriptional regulator LsrR (DeoR family)